MNKAEQVSTLKLGPALGTLAARESRSLLRALAMRKKRHEGIHATRKSCRKLRCLIRFLPASEPLDAMDHALKQLARSFSAQRDAHIAARTARLLATSREPKLTPNVVEAFATRSEHMLDNALQDDPHWRRRRADAHRIVAACNAMRWEDVRPSSAKKTLKRTTRKMKKAQKEAAQLHTTAADHRWRRRARKVRYQLELLRKARRMADMKKSRTKHYGKRAKQLAAVTDRLGWRQDFKVFIKTANLLPEEPDVLALRKALKTTPTSWSKSEPSPASHA